MSRGEWAGDPALRVALLKIARRYQRKGALGGTMKLGQGLDPGDLAALENFFGLDPLRVTAGDEVILSLDRLLAGKSDSEAREWLAEVHHGLGLPMPEPAAPAEDQAEQARKLLDRLRLAFPELAPVHAGLREDAAGLGRRLGRLGEESCARLYFQAATIVRFLLGNRTPVTVSELGARFSEDSKSLRRGELRKLVEEWLRLVVPQLAYLPEDGLELWQYFQVVTDRITVNAVIYGPLVYRKNGREHDWIYQLWRQGEPATIGWPNLAGIEAIYWAGDQAGDRVLITCENEAPFSRLLREPGGAAILFTGGFAGSAVLELYRLLAPGARVRRHWGDSDLAGLRIAAILHAVHPLELWRCDLATLQRHQDHLLPLEEGQARAATGLLAENPDFPFAAELRFALEHGWLEQESWGNSPPAPHLRPAGTSHIEGL